MVEAKIEILLSNGSKAGETLKELTQQANRLNKEIKNLKPGSEEFIAKSKDLAVVNSSMKDVKDQIKGTTIASETMKKSMGGVLNLIPGFSQISSAFGSAQGSVGGLTKGMGILRTAFLAVPILALVAAIAALVSAVMKFVPWADKVEQIFAGMKAVVDVVIDRLITFGKGLWQIVNGNVTEGLEMIAESTTGMGKAMDDAYQAGKQLQKTIQDLEDAARGLAMANAEAEASVNRLIVQAKNKSLSDAQQLALLKQAREIAEQNAKKNQEQLEGEYKSLIDQAKLKSQLTEDEIVQLARGTLAYETEYEKRGSLEDDLLDKIKDKYIERVQAAGEAGKLLDKVANAEAIRNERIKADQEKANQANQKKEEEAAKERLRLAKEETDAKINLHNLENELYLAGIEDEKQKELAALSIGTNDKIAALTGSAELIAQQTLALKQLELQGIKDIEDKYIEQKKTSDQAESERKANQAEKDKQIAIQKAQEEADAKRAIKQAELEFASGALSIVIGLLGEDEKARKKNAVAIKAFSTAKILVDLQQEIAGYMANPASTATLGVVGTLKTVLAIARAAVAIKQVASQKFQSGGVLRGPAHAQGGIPIEAEGDEIILTKGVYRNPALRSVASAINAMAGGKRFANGGPVNPLNGMFNSRFADDSNYQNRSDDPFISGRYLDKRVDELEAFARRVDGWASKLVVVNDVTKTMHGIQTVNKLKADADT